jgi:hypothetical protein
MRTLLFTICMNLSILGFGQFSDKKSEVHAYKINKDADVSIQHRNGKIRVITWAKDSVRFESNLQVESNSLDKNHQILSNARYNISAQASSVYFSSDLGIGNLKKEWETLKSKTGLGNIRIDSDLVVYVPETCNLRLDHKYGDIDLESYSGPLTILLTQGDLKAKDLSGLEKLECKFCDVRIEKIEKSDLTLLFSEVNIKSAGNLRIDSKSSEIRIKSAKKITCVTTKDRLEIDELDDMLIFGNLTKLYVGDLTSTMLAELKFGKIRVDRVSEKCTDLTFRVHNTDVELNLEPSTSFQVAAKGEELDVQYPTKMGKIELIDGSKTGYIGASNASSTVTAFGTKSTISFYVNNN